MTSVTLQPQPTGPDAPETEQPKKYAGKFDTAEEMESSYLEAQKKISELTAKNPKDEAAVETEETSEEKPKDKADAESEGTTDEEVYGVAVASAMKAAGLSGTDLAAEYEANGGSLKDESYAALEKAGYPRAMVESYLRGISAPAEMAEAEVSKIMDIVGGKEEYNNMLGWILNDLSKEEAEEFDRVVGSGDLAAARFAVTAMTARFKEANGSEGRRLEGKGGTDTDLGGYAHKDEMLADMRDPRYNSSAAFRKQVEDKIAKKKF